MRPLPQIASVLLQKRTSRTVRLCQNDRARRLLLCPPQEPEGNVLLPSRPDGSSALSGRHCNIRSIAVQHRHANVAMVTASAN
jgi:hypothetical protein